MCGRYAMALRPSQVRAYLENEHMPVYDAPADEDEELPGAPRQSYNFAPGYYGVVYRADTADWGAGPRQHTKDEEVSNDEPQAVEGGEVRYKLQSMKWGLVPFWTKRNPDYGSTMKTINCRDDSLIENKGMWNTMKQKKRCVVVAQGFYEWLKKGKEKVPHYVKRKDGQLMCFAGLWDCVQYEGSDDKHYTYTIITTDSNKQLNFLHDRMPVILENGSEDLQTWLDPKRCAWSQDLQALLKPSAVELEIYSVNKEVGKVGNNSPNFIIPVASSENKANIANFFANAKEAKEAKEGPTSTMPSKKTKTEEVKGKKFVKDEVTAVTTGGREGEDDVKKEEYTAKKEESAIKKEEGEDRKTMDHNGTEDNAPLPVPAEETGHGIKREVDDAPDVAHAERARKFRKTSPKTTRAKKTGRQTRSATSNNTASPTMKSTGQGSGKITNFFGK